MEGDTWYGCEACVGRCQFEALTMTEGVAVANYLHCVGCGLCVLVYPTEALHLNRRKVGEVPVPPTDIAAWRVQRESGHDR